MKQRNVGSLLDSVREAMGATRLRHPLGKLTAAGVGALTPLMAFANPTGGQVVGGAASITTPSGNKTVIDQTSQNAIINWQQFSVGAHQYVQFVQPNSSSVVLNRVISNDPSRIFGNISANGQVFLVNPNGVFFAPGSSLDAAGILASTLDIKNNDFMQGNYVFAKGKNAPDATIINQGSMSATRNGYVVLSGDYVENDGRIQAQTGRVYLAAGANATLTFDSHNLISYTVDGATLARLAGAVNAGDIVATGGSVVMTGDVANALTATAVNNQGFIAAKSMQDHSGTIVLEATGGELINSGRLVTDAAASAPNAGGGTIILRGNQHTQLTSTSRIDAAGGGIGAGGFIELSGHTLGVKGAATAGKGGEVLIDPALINIVSGNVNGAGTGATNSVGTGFIAATLQVGNNVTIVASNSIHNQGSIARTITATGVGNLVFETGTVSCPTGICTTGTPTVTQQSGTINLTGLTINIAGNFTAHAGFSSGANGHVTLGNVTAKGITITGEFINVGNLHATGTPGISINAVGSSDDGGSLNAGTLTADTGPVRIVQEGGRTGISVGAIQAAGGVLISDGSGNALLNVNINGNVTGSNITIEAQGGNIDVNGNVKATNGSVFMTARTSGSRSGGNMDVTGTITAQHGGVNLRTFGGGSAEAGISGGGNLTVGGAIAAGGSVSIDATYRQSGHAFKVQTAGITAGNSGASRGGIQITMHGPNPQMNVGALVAKGPLTSNCSVGECGIPQRTGDVVLAIHPTVQGSGSIKVASAKSSHGNISIDASPGYGFAPITATGTLNAVAGNVTVVGSNLNLKNINAGGSVSLHANQVGSNAEIIVAGNITAGNDVSVTESSSFAGNAITLGTVTAGEISISGSKITTGALHATASSIRIIARASASSSAFIKTGALTVDNGHLALLASGGGASINVTGNISVPQGSLSTFHAHSLINAAGAKIKVTGNITAHEVIMQADGGGASDSIIVTGGITTTTVGSGASARLSASNFNSASGNAKVQVGGTINSNKSVTLSAAAANIAAAPLVSAVAINADKTPCTILDCNPGDINVTANRGTINLTGNLSAGSGTVRPGGVTLNGRNINFGNISAPGEIDVTAQSISSVGATGITQTAGTTLKARVINVDLNASYGGAIVLANLDASSAAAPAIITIQAFGGHRDASVTVNGNIIVNGKAESSFSSAMPGFGIPYGARLQLSAAGSSAAAAYTVKVNGSITLNAVAGTVHEGTSCGECGPNNSKSGINGTGGKAFVNMSAQGSHGSVAITGPMSVTGPEAFVQMNAVTIKTGAISVTGKGQTLVYSDSFGQTFSHGGTTHTNIGQAGVFLGSNGSAVNVTTGNITVQGKGWARVSVRGSNVTAGNIAITASAAKTIRAGSSSAFGSNSGQQFGAFGLALAKGNMSIGLAQLSIGSHGNPSQVKNLNLGNVSVTGVGEADIDLAATSIKTRSLSALTTKGTMVGSDTSVLGEGSIHVTHTFNITGGQAAIEVDTGLASAGAIAITGNVTASGPTAGVTLSGHSVKVSGNVGAVGSGGVMTSDVVATGGSVYHTHFTGPGNATTVTIADGTSSIASVNVGGTVSVKGPGLVGIHIAADKVTLGGLSASAGVAAAYSVLDTRVSATADNFTVGSVAVLVDATSANGGFLPATVNGNVTISAPHGNIFLPSQLSVTGQVKLTALGNIGGDATTIGQRFNELGNVVGNHGSSGSSGSSNGAPKGAAQPLVLKAAGVSMVAGGSIDLTGAFMNVSKVAQLVADKNIVLSGVSITAGTLSATASGSVQDSGVAGTITANGLAVIAGKNISLSGTQLNIGNGSVASVHGDAELILGLTEAGIAPLASNPNGAFIAGGSVSLGGLKLTGSYLLLQGTAVSILGPVSVPTGTLVQVVPFDTTGPIDIEDAPSASSVLTLAATSSGFFLNNQGFISLFSGDTVAVGNSDETGNVTLGTNGPIDIGDTNLIIDTTGTITGLSTVTSTGIVNSLISILGPPVPPPTAGEIDPNSGNTANPNKKNGNGGVDTGTGGGTGGTITQDTGTASVCH